MKPLSQVVSPWTSLLVQRLDVLLEILITIISRCSTATRNILSPTQSLAEELQC